MPTTMFLILGCTVEKVDHHLLPLDEGMLARIPYRFFARWGFFTSVMEETSCLIEQTVFFEPAIIAQGDKLNSTVCSVCGRFVSLIWSHDLFPSSATCKNASTENHPFVDPASFQIMLW